MSHITNVRLRVMDLSDLETAARARGLELRRGQTTHRWFGRFVGDTRPPEGLDPKDYGKCLHAIGVPGDSQAYEIGVVRALDGGDGFDLVVDTWQQQKLLALAGGQELNGLRREYAAAVATRRARSLAREGFSVRREDLPGHRVRLRLVRR